MYDLPSEFPEEPGLPDEFHDLQPQLLSSTLHLAEYSRDNWFTGSDLNVYYDVHHPLWHKRPDWFLAVDVPRLYNGCEMRQSYVLWQEGRPPAVVVELLSPGTEREDLGRFYEEDNSVPAVENELSSRGLESPDRIPGKLEVYERYLAVPHYIVFSRYTQQLRYFKRNGSRYCEQPLQAEPPLIWLDDLKIGLGLWQGEFDGISRSWLRWCDAIGNWFLTEAETAERRAEAERQAKEQIQQQVEQAEQRAERLAQRLRELGIDPDEV
jgi:Uma2 family endonuclease